MTGPLDADDSLVGTVLDGRYRIERILGVGGMGAVYQGKHELLGTAVAVKVMRSSQPDAAKRFLAEARRTFRLDHPNCVRVTDAGVVRDRLGTGAVNADELLYLVMELLSGRTLGEELENDGPLAPHRVAHIGAQIAAALGCAHDLGYVHRDIKPDNIMLLHRGGDPDFTKVLDFGLAKLTDAARLDGKHSVVSFTRNGMVFGTPHYMSPEQAQGHRLDSRSDLYSLGVLLYECLAGGPPFDSDSEVEVLIAHVTKEPPPLRDYCDAPANLNRAVMRMLAKDPDGRPSDALEVIELLTPIAAKRPRPSGAGGRVAASETLALPDSVSAELPRVPTSRSTAPTAVTHQVGAADNLTHGMMPPRRSPLLAIAVVLLAAAAIVSIWAMTRTPASEPPLDAALAGATNAEATGPAAAVDASAIADAAAVEIDAAPVREDAGANTSNGETAAQRKAKDLYRKAMAAMRTDKGELSYLPVLQAAHKLDRKNRKIRGALIKALLASKGEPQRALGCRMIRRQKSRYKREGCDSLSGD